VSVTIEIATQSPAWENLAGAEAAVRRAVEAALRDERIEEGEIGIALTDDARIQALNKNFRGLDKTTNVLAFPPPKSPANGPKPIGDIVIAYETMAREAEAEGKTAEHHLMHLAVHGTLHLLGFDHIEEADAAAMEARERAILADLGISDPYARYENTGAAA
jgi:probable rRNA maturation factor